MTELALHHLALGATDVERVASFYAEHFSLPEIARHRHPNGSLRSVWLGLGKAILMIEHTDGPARPTPATEPAAGLFLIAFRVDEAGRAALERRLVEQGIAIEHRTSFTSYARDPEGNRFAFSTYPDEPTS